MNTRPLDKDEATALGDLNEAGIESVLIYLTETGLKKSILDATAPMRLMLLSSGIHNFETQPQGPDYKLMLPATFYHLGMAREMKVSVYRPKTKNGDPRLWPYRLGRYAKANDVLAAFVHEGRLQMLNLSASRNVDLMFVETDLSALLSSITLDYEAIANELLELLRGLSARGPIKAIGTKDTSIGRTIEAALGIDMNSSQLPDFKGIELKAKRIRSNTRNGLFAQVPNWDLSSLKSFREIVDRYGYQSEKDFRLYCTMSAKGPNSQGLLLNVDEAEERLDEVCRKNGTDEKVCVWLLEKLHDRLQSKHRETFWIGAEEIKKKSGSYFRLDNVRHTRRPSNFQFDRLLAQGDITVDHMIKLTDGKVKEKGPQFKVLRGALDELFLGSPRSYRL